VFHFRFRNDSVASRHLLLSSLTELLEKQLLADSAPELVGTLARICATIGSTSKPEFVSQQEFLDLVNFHRLQLSLTARTGNLQAFLGWLHHCESESEKANFLKRALASPGHVHAGWTFLIQALVVGDSTEEVSTRHELCSRFRRLCESDTGAVWHKIIDDGFVSLFTSKTEPEVDNILISLLSSELADVFISMIEGWALASSEQSRWRNDMVLWCGKQLANVGRLNLEVLSKVVSFGATLCLLRDSYTFRKNFVVSLFSALGNLVNENSNLSNKITNSGKGFLLVRWLVALSSFSIPRVEGGYDTLASDQSELLAQNTRQKDSRAGEVEEGTRPAREQRNSSGERRDQVSKEEDHGDSDDCIDSRCCTFTVTGSQFVEQHWYFCYTCGLSGSEGMCSICAQVCHKGHEISYSRRSRFFCDCGASAHSSIAPVDENSGASREAGHVQDGADDMPMRKKKAIRG